MGVMAFSISLRVICLARRGRAKGEREGEEAREEREKQPRRREGIKN